MNVLHLDEQRGWRGGEQQASWLLQGLAKRGHTNVIAGRPGSGWLQNDHGGVDLIRLPLPCRHELDLRSIRGLARAIREHQIDILHAHSSHAHGLACYARFFAPSAKVVVSRRVSNAPKSNLLNRYKYRLPDRYLCVSKRVDEVLAVFGIPASQRTVVYSAVDLERVDVSPLSREKLGVSRDIPLLVTAGALTHQKDHATLLRALPNVLKEFPNAQLLIAGEGELRPALEQQIRDLRLQEHVTLLGHRSDVPALIKAADLYVSPSWTEGLGTSVLEALACAVPVVATDAGGVPEMVIDGETGRIVPRKQPDALAQAIVSALNDPEPSKRMALAGKKLVEENFTVDRMIEDTLEVYKEMLS